MVVSASRLTRRPDTNFFFFFRVTQALPQDANVLKTLVLGHVHVLDVSSACMEMQKTSLKKKQFSGSKPHVRALLTRIYAGERLSSL